MGFPLYPCIYNFKNEKLVFKLGRYLILEGDSDLSIYQKLNLASSPVASKWQRYDRKLNRCDA